jgi:hypothetical protein
MKEEKETTTPVSEAQIKQWKARWGEVFEITTNTDEGKVASYFKKPNLDCISAASKFATEDPIKSGNILFENCKLWLNPAIEGDDEAKMGIIQALGQLFKVKEAEIKKL